MTIGDAVVQLHEIARKLAHEGDGELAHDLRVIADRLNEKHKWSEPESMAQIRKAI